MRSGPPGSPRYACVGAPRRGADTARRGRSAGCAAAGDPPGESRDRVRRGALGGCGGRGGARHRAGAGARLPARARRCGAHAHGRGGGDDAHDRFADRRGARRSHAARRARRGAARSRPVHGGCGGSRARAACRAWRSVHRAGTGPRAARRWRRIWKARGCCWPRSPRRAATRRNATARSCASWRCARRRLDPPQIRLVASLIAHDAPRHGPPGSPLDRSARSRMGAPSRIRPREGRAPGR